SRALALLEPPPAKLGRWRQHVQRVLDALPQNFERGDFWEFSEALDSGQGKRFPETLRRRAAQSAGQPCRSRSINPAAISAGAHHRGRYHWAQRVLTPG